MQNYNDLKDIAAESGAIASLIYHPDFILHSDFLKPNMFSQAEDGCIYWAIDELYKNGIDNIDEINLNNQMQSDPTVKKVMKSKGLSDIKDIIDMSQYAARDTLPEYLELCKTVCTYAYKREVYKFSEELKRDTLREDSTVSKLEHDSHEKFSEITEKFLISDEIRTISDANPDILDELVDRQNSDAVMEIPSKFKEFAPYFSYEKGELVVVKARAKTGKSLFLMSEALNAAMNGLTVVYIDTEIDDKHFYWRMLANLSGVRYSEIKSNHWTQEETNRIRRADQTIKSLKLYHFYMPVIDMDKVFSICKVLQYKDNLSLIVFDYLKAVGATDMGLLSNKLATQTNDLKNRIAGTLKLPVLAACQLNRNMDTFGSDQINMYLSTSIKLVKKTPDEIREDGGYKFGALKANVDLNRNGAMMDDDEYISLGFDGDHCNIYSCEQPTKSAPYDMDEDDY